MFERAQLWLFVGVVALAAMAGLGASLSNAISMRSESQGVLVGSRAQAGALSGAAAARRVVSVADSPRQLSQSALDAINRNLRVLSDSASAQTLPPLQALPPADVSRRGPAYLYRGAREKWADQRYALGDRANRIETSWEKEGGSLQILEFYRPAEVDEARWASMPLHERIAHAESLDEKRWARDWRRLDSSPTWMREKLVHESEGRIWETTSDTFATTLEDLWDQVGFVAERFGEGFHYHASFLPDPRMADAIGTYLGHLDEVVTLQAYNRAPARRAQKIAEAKLFGRDSQEARRLLYSNVAHTVLRPQRQRNIDDVTRALEGSARLGLMPKTHAVGFRSSIYGPGRVGYELRAAASRRFARVALEGMFDFLEEPHGADLRLLATTPSFSVADLADVRRLANHPLLELRGPGAHALQEGLKDIAKASNTLETERAKSTGFAKKSLQYEYDHWGYPLMDWESRPYLEGLETQIASAREQYVEDLRKLVAEWNSAGETGRATQLWGDRANFAVERFVHDSGIADVF